MKDHSRLQSIPIDRVPVNSSLTISDFKHIAFLRLYSVQVNTGELPQSTTAELFLSHCYLSSKASAAITLNSLDLKGTADDPLDVFVVPTRTDGCKLQETWGFNSSDRGIATFLTCLKLFMKRLCADGSALDFSSPRVSPRSFASDFLLALLHTFRILEPIQQDSRSRSSSGHETVTRREWCRSARPLQSQRDCVYSRLRSTR